MRTSVQNQRLFVVAVAAFSLLFFWSEITRLTFRLPVTGVTTRLQANGYIIVRVAPSSPGAKAGLRAGDYAPADDTGLQASDVLFSGVAQPASRLRNVSLVVQRDGAQKVLRIAPNTRPESPYLAVRIIARLLSYTAFVIIGAWIVFVRPTAMSWLLFAYCLGAIAPSGDLRAVIDIWFGNGTTADTLLSGIALAFARVAQASIPLFALRFPNDAPDAWRAKLYAPAMVLAVLYMAATWTSALFFYSESALSTMGWCDLLLLAAAIAIIVDTFLRSRGLDRQRLKWAAAAMIIALTCDIGNETFRFLTHHTQEGIAIGAVFTVLAVLTPVMLAYSILKHHIFDVAFVVNKAVVYTATSVVIIVVLSGFEFLIEHFASAYTHAENLLAEFVVALGVVFAVRPIHTRIDALVDRVFFHDRHEQEAGLRAFAETAGLYDDSQRLVTDTVQALQRFGAVQGVAIYRNYGEGLKLAYATLEDAPQYVPATDAAAVRLRTQRNSLDIHHFDTEFPGVRLYRALLAGRLFGVVALGERSSGDEMPPDVGSAVALVAESTALALQAIEMKMPLAGAVAR